VNVVDVAVILFAVALAGIGYERGLLRSALPLAGFVGGLWLGGRLAPELLSQGSKSAYAPVVALICGVGVGAFLAITLEGVGIAIEERMPQAGAIRRIDGFAGAILLVAMALFVAWAVGAVALHSPNPGVRGVRAAFQESRILRSLNEVLPPSGPLLNVLRRIDPTPAVRGPEPDVRPPDPAIASDPEVRSASGSVVKVLGTACGLGVEGSGWVAKPGVVVTNAHVVAGTDDTTVTPLDGAPLDATAVHFDPRNDVAILRVGSLGAPALSLVPDPQKGTSGAIIGYPENGPLAFAAARIGGTGTVLSEDAYGRGPVERSMTPFKGEVRSGNSGGPVVDGLGRVLATVFAANLGTKRPGGLGVPNSVVSNALSGPLEPTDTGPCTA
jgi:S1-C subfamily serine protease